MLASHPTQEEPHPGDPRFGAPPAPASTRLTTAIVIALVAAVLAGLIFGALQAIKRLARHHTGHDVVAAVDAFYHDYAHLPVHSPATDHNGAVGGPWLTALEGRNPSINPRGIVDFTPPPGSVHPPGNVVDSWGTPFQIVLDTNADGTINHPDPASPTPVLHQRSLVYSAGPDRNPATWHDNLVAP